MITESIYGQVLNAGHAEGSILVLDEPLSFWGGFNPLTGEIIDRRHPQSGQVIQGRVLLMPYSRGSAGTPAGVAESLRLGVGPVAFILGQIDVNITVGAMVADKLFATATPIITVNKKEYETLSRCASQLRISESGLIEVHRIDRG